MAAGYFDKFPITLYNGTPSVNILKRTGFNENVRRYLTSFYTYTVEEDFRIDSIAHDYYDDVNYDWLIYQTNDIVDPYHQVRLGQYDFEAFIIKKYGSLREAKRRIAFYRNNYRGDDSMLSVPDYDSLPMNLKKYWDPVSNMVSVVGYQRSTEDFTYATNRIISLQLELDQQLFEVGEFVYNVNNTNMTGEVVHVSTDECIIRHVSGFPLQPTTFWDNPFELKGEKSNVTRTVVDLNYDNPVIPTEEAVYYSPVSFYDIEAEENEANAEIFLVEKSQLQTINRQLTTLLK